MLGGVGKAIEKAIRNYSVGSKIKKAVKAIFDPALGATVEAIEDGAFLVSVDWSGPGYNDRVTSLSKSTRHSIISIEAGKMVLSPEPFETTDIPTYKSNLEIIAKAFDRSEISYETFQSIKGSVVPFIELRNGKPSPVFVNQNILKSYKLSNPFVCNYCESETDILKSAMESETIPEETKAGIEIILSDKEGISKSISSTMKYSEYMPDDDEDFDRRSRDKMPQIDSEDLIRFLLHFSQKGAPVQTKKIQLNKIKPAQNEFNDGKILKIFEASAHKGSKFVISKDGYLLDGHHRWAAGLEDDPEQEVEVYQIDLPIKRLIHRANQLGFTTKSDVTKAGSSEQLEKTNHADELSKAMQEFDAGSLKNSKGEAVIDRNQAVAIAYNRAGMSKGDYLAEISKAANTRSLIEPLLNDSPDFILGYEAASICYRFKMGESILAQVFHTENTGHVKAIAKEQKIEITIMPIDETWSLLTNSVGAKIADVFQIETETVNG